MADMTIEERILELRSKFPTMGQGSSSLVREGEDVVDEVAASRDANGFTHPNLHRRIDTPPDGSINRKYALGIYGLDSYRTVEYITHDEESTTSEIP